MIQYQRDKRSVKSANRFVYILFVFLISDFNLQAKPVDAGLTASIALIERVVPAYANKFRVELLNSETDEFEIESVGGKIVLRGNNGVSVASALYYYISEFGKGQITWNGSNLRLPEPLPQVTKKIRKKTVYQHRYYLNYCTFNYSMSWWDWERWEKEIDWMALHGINMPLAITGQEYVWNQVYTDMGFSEKDLETFFCGPAYFAWFWMGNLDGWGGPLPKTWMQRQKLLQQKIVTRQRELGMKPVLPAFTGHVPPAFRTRYPDAKLKQTNWGNGFNDTFILDSSDPMFEEIGRRFITAQTKIFGTDHFYSADTFNENEPPSDDPEFISELSKRVYNGMKSADPKAVWVMQGWLFYSDRKFWKTPQIKALLNAVPDDKMIILDLATEIEPVWKRTEAFYGKPWIWNMLHNFGGNNSLFGRIDGVAAGPASAIADSTSGNLKGIGLTMEAIEQNPVLYELLTDHTWRSQPIDLDKWLAQYVENRYGSVDEHALKAWKILRKSVYNGKDIRDGAESIIAARPTLESERRWAKTKLNYRPIELVEAWNEMILAAPACKNSDGFQYDVVDITRQVLANYALAVHANVKKSYIDRNLSDFKIHSDLFIDLMEDMDMLLATKKDFMLGTWIEQARSCGTSDEEKALYERNARNLITLWGNKDNGLHEYSCRQWNGLVNDFYKQRWMQFFEVLTHALATNTDADFISFEQTIKTWEWNWVNSSKRYPIEPTADAMSVVEGIFKKYSPSITDAYKE
jgi:alpha-N-acetylglucosaminidase